MPWMKDFLIDIKNKVDNSKETQESYAKRIGISPSHFSNIIKQTSKLDLYPFIKLVRFFYHAEQANQFIKMFLIKNNTDDKLKAAMEYSLFMEDFELLKEVLDISETIPKKSASLKEWINVYNEFLIEKDPMKIYNKVKYLPIKSEELKIFKEIMEIRRLYLSKDQNAILDYIDTTKNRVSLIKNDLIRDFYTIRLCMFSGYVNFYLNNIEVSISELEKIIKLGLDDKKLAHIYHALGLNYFKINIHMTLKYLGLSKKIFEKNKNQCEIENVQNSINFSACYAGKLDYYKKVNSTSIENIHNEAFKNIRQGNYELAIKLLGSIEKAKMSNNNKAFHKYFMGLIYKKPEYFYESATYFRMCFDKVYCTLPCDELLKIGEPIYQINSAYGEFIY